MYYVEQYQRYRQGSLKFEQKLRKSTSQNWSLCSHEYEAKCPPLNSSSASDVFFDHQQQTVLFLSQLASIDKKSMDKSSHQRQNTPSIRIAITDDQDKYSFPSLIDTSAKSATTGNALEDTIRRSISAKVKSKGNHSHYKRDTSPSILKFNKEDQDIPLILHRSQQYRMNGVEHIVNLGRWQPRNNSPKPNIDHESCTETDTSSLEPSPDNELFKSPFPEEYDQAIAIQGQLVSANNYHDWNLRDFYRDVQTPLDPNTNTRTVFERCLKLARLQANTIKWEHRRRQNLTIYHRLMKNNSPEHTLSNSVNGNLSARPHIDRDINELKRELRCQDCKRYTCLGNCAPGHDYHQYKRMMSLTTLLSSRESSTRSSKLSQRQARSSLQFRPRSRHELVQETKYKIVSSQINSISVVPSPILVEATSTMKSSSKK